jgi:hypothetical protein
MRNFVSSSEENYEELKIFKNIDNDITTENDQLSLLDIIKKPRFNDEKIYSLPLIDS